MTTNNRVRTPRKEKSWAFTNTALTLSLSDQGGIDLLDAYKIDLGIDQLRNVTSMRIVGRVALRELSNAATPAYVTLGLGIAWINVNILTLANSIPWSAGTRDHEWLQLGHIEGAESASAINERPAEAPGEAAFWDIDIRQMRKQPTPQHKLMFVYSANGLQESGTLKISVRTAVMLALP